MSALFTLAFWQQWLDPDFLTPFVQTFWQPFLAGLAFALLGIFPLAARKVVGYLRTRTGRPVAKP